MIKAALAGFALSALGLAAGLTGLEMELDWLTYGGMVLSVGAGLGAHVLAIWGWFRLPRAAGRSVATSPTAGAGRTST